MNTDRIEKQVLLRAPIARVWRALSDAQEFGSWFGMRLDTAFSPGATVKGVVVPTSVDSEVAKAQEPYEGMPVELHVETMTPEKEFSFRWHPGAIDPEIDYAKEPTTLVTFTLEQTVDGVLLRVVESGFDRLPLERRAKAFAQNAQGWTMIISLIEKYLAHAS